MTSVMYTLGGLNLLCLSPGPFAPWSPFCNHKQEVQTCKLQTRSAKGDEILDDQLKEALQKTPLHTPSVPLNR